MIFKVLLLYVVAGLVFGGYYVMAGAAKLDPAAKGSSLGFRLMLFPAAVALWPWLLKRLSQGGGELA